MKYLLLVKMWGLLSTTLLHWQGKDVYNENRAYMHARATRCIRVGASVVGMLFSYSFHLAATEDSSARACESRRSHTGMLKFMQTRMLTGKRAL